MQDARIKQIKQIIQLQMHKLIRVSQTGGANSCQLLERKQTLFLNVG